MGVVQKLGFLPSFQGRIVFSEFSYEKSANHGNGAHNSSHDFLILWEKGGQEVHKSTFSV